MDGEAFCEGVGSLGQQLPLQRGALSDGFFSLLQVHNAVSIQAGSTCVPLTNRGSHFTAELEVGTPAQGNFSVIVDTGSTSLIIQSCACHVSGHCRLEQHGHCFTGTNASRSFSIVTKSGAVKPQLEEHIDPIMVQMTFGSGTIIGIPAEDVVGLGKLRVNMREGFVLMVDEALDIAGPTLEGILGLGLPSNVSMLNSTSDLEAQPTSSPVDLPKVNSFLEQAGISRFSMCFEGEAGGVLRLGTTKPSKPLGSYGQVHWGLGIEGISVAGDRGLATPIAVELCTPDSMKPGQDTPCGAIPDSGTTMITGPKAHFVIMSAALCDAWPRCSKNATQQAVPTQPGMDQDTAELIVKAGVFDLLLEDCSSWANSTEYGVGELPTLNFHITGMGGGKQIVSLPGNAYTMQTTVELMRVEYQEIPFFGRIPLRQVPTGETKLVCLPAFSPMEYNTEKNGPVFILGLPLFYEYSVSYDLSTEPPEMGLESLEGESCGLCGVEGHGLELSETDSRQRRRWPRHTVSEHRRTSIDVTKPM